MMPCIGDRLSRQPAGLGLRCNNRDQLVCLRNFAPRVSPRSPLMISCAQKKRQAEQSFSRREVPFSDILITLAAAGSTTGTFLDGFHSKVQLLIYDVLPLSVGGLQTSACVPPLLATFYVVLGSLVLFMDYRMVSDPTTKAAMQGASLSKMAVSFGVLAAMLQLSSYLYVEDYSSSTICLILAACAAINYLVFDGTKQGLFIALLCATAAPASELLLMNTLDLWHYPNGELCTSIAGGIPKWVPFCYFFYVPAVSNLARYLWKII